MIRLGAKTAVVTLGRGRPLLSLMRARKSPVSLASWKKDLLPSAGFAMSESRTSRYPDDWGRTTFESSEPKLEDLQASLRRAQQ